MTNIGTIPEESFITVVIGAGEKKEQKIGVIDEEFLEKMRKLGQNQLNEDYTEIDIDLIDESDGKSVKSVDGKLGCANAVDYLS